MRLQTFIQSYTINASYAGMEEMAVSYTHLEAMTLIETLAFNFFNISKDGTMMGPNLEMLKKLKESVSINVIASGGIKDITHIQALKELGIYGAITGKAMYAKTLSLPEALTDVYKRQHNGIPDNCGR